MNRNSYFSDRDIDSDCFTDQIAFPLNMPDALEQEYTSSIRYRTLLLDWLGSIIPLGGGCCTLTDPNTLLSAGAVVEHQLEQIHTRLLEYEYTHPCEPDAYAVLARSHTYTSILSRHPEHELRNHSRYREILLPAGFIDELRIALLYKRKCWGFLTLFRKQGQPLFTESELQWIDHLSSVIAARLRIFSLAPAALNTETTGYNMGRTSLSPAADFPTAQNNQTAWARLSAADHEGSQPNPRSYFMQNHTNHRGILILSHTLQLLSANSAASSWLKQLRQLEGISTAELPRSLQAAAFQAAQSHSSTPVCSCIPAGEHYITLRIEILYTPADNLQIMIEMQPASAHQILMLRCEAHDLTPREQDIIQQLLLGQSTRQIADALYISPFTVQDHLKSIFIKTKTSSRRELITYLQRD